MQRGLLADGREETSKIQKFVSAVCWELAKTIPSFLEPTSFAGLIVDKLKEKALGEGARFAVFVLMDSEKLEKELTTQEKAARDKDKNNRSFFKELGTGVLLLVIAGAGPTAAIVPGIIIATAAFKWLLKREAIQRKQRWEEIVDSMMTKYRNILTKRLEQQTAKALMEASVEEIRKDTEFELEQVDEKKFLPSEDDKTGVPVTMADLKRFKIYSAYILNWRVAEKMYSDADLAKAYLVCRKNVERNDKDPWFWAKYDAEEIGEERKKVKGILEDGLNLWDPRDDDGPGLQLREMTPIEISASFLVNIQADRHFRVL